MTDSGASWRFEPASPINRVLCRRRSLRLLNSNAINKFQYIRFRPCVFELGQEPHAAPFRALNPRPWSGRHGACRSAASAVTVEDDRDGLPGGNARGNSPRAWDRRKVSAPLMQVSGMPSTRSFKTCADRRLVFGPSRVSATLAPARPERASLIIWLIKKPRRIAC